MPVIKDSALPSNCNTKCALSISGHFLYDFFAILVNTLSTKLCTALCKNHANQTQENVVSYSSYWLRRRRHTPPSLMTIPGELRNRICDFVFEIPHPPNEDPSLLNNDHLPNHFNLLLCSRQLRNEQLEKIFKVNRFFQDFEALDAWISRGLMVGSKILPRMRQIGIQTGRAQRRLD
jgi:hypothetical protein